MFVVFSPADFAAMAEIIDLVPWPENGNPVYVAPAVLFPLVPKRTMLTSVKDTLYHPVLPTLRQMDMDTIANKLTNEHCRTSTVCCKGKWHSQPVDTRSPGEAR